MDKKKIPTTVIFCLSFASITLAVEVISIDFNGQGDDTPYTGQAAIADQTVWRAYYGGWGVAVGSERTSYLRNYDQPGLPSTYAAQVWIGDNGLNHDYVWGSNLMDDGFDANGVTNPYISFITSALNPALGAGAYTGTFDIYVYGSTAGDFTLTINAIPTTKSVTGGFYGAFVEGENYVIFPDVTISPGAVITLSYTGMLNGLQLVSDKEPVHMISGGITKIPAANYDVAHETNGQVGPGSSSFGPDIAAGEVTLIDAGEYIIYDITVDEANEGRYELSAWLYDPVGNECRLEIYLDDDIYLGDLILAPAINPAPVLSDNSILFNLFEGIHTIKWRTRTPQTLFLNSFDFDRQGPVVMDDCNDINFYQFDFRSDYNKNCRVDAADLNEITSHWLEDYTPEEPNFPPSPPTPPPCKKTLYIDGVYINDANANEWLTFPYDRITIGSEGNRWYMYNEYVGKIDDFAIYAGVLSDARVVAHWNARGDYATYQAAVAADNPLLWLMLDEADTNDGMVANNSAGIIDGTYVARGIGVVIKPTAGFVAGSNGVELNVNGRVPEMGEANGVCIDVWDGDGVFGEDLEGDVTIELWVNYTDINDYPRFFQHNGSWDVLDSYGLSALLNDGNTLAVFGGGDVNFMDFDNDINDGNWHHIVVTYDSTYPIPPFELSYENFIRFYDEPVLYLRFEEYPFVDSSGNDYWVDADPLVSIEKVKGSIGNAAHLNGGWIAAANQQTEPSLPTDYNHLYAFSPDDLTVEFWLYSPDANEDDFASLFTQCQGELEYAPGATRAGSKCRMLFGDNRPEPNGYVYTDDGAWESDQNWHHFVAVWDEIPDVNGNPYQINVKWYTDTVIYKNETFDANVANGYLGPEMDHILIGRLGSRDNITGAPYQGYIDEFAIYPYVLSEDRIEAHYLAWQPWGCYELWYRQMMPPWAVLVDRDENCYIDFHDFAEFALEWALCNDPQGGPGCVPNW